MQTYVYRGLFTVIVTIYVQIWFPKSRIEKHSDWWAFMFVAYTLSFGITWLNDLA